MTTLAAHLSTIGSSREAAAVRYMSEGRDCGALETVFGGDVAEMQVGAAQGQDASRAAYDWWPVTLHGEQIGELRDDAAGYTFHDPAA